MNYKLNEYYIYKIDGEKLKITNLLPDHNEIYHFEGPSVKILHSLFINKKMSKQSAEAAVGSAIPDQDWNTLIEFLLSKGILLPS